MSKYKIKVSVVVPVYNADFFLEKCLNSICAQSLKELEVFCVDDGSTDKSWSIIQRFAKKDKRIIGIQQLNKGAAVARNQGLKHAQGEYIGFVDSDDYVDSDYFKQLYDVAKKQDADISRAYVKAESVGKSIYAKEVAQNNKAYEDMYNTEGRKAVERNKLNLRNVIWLSIYRRSMLKKNNITFNPAIRTGQDVIFNTETSYYTNKVVYVENKTHYHRVIRDGSLMSEYNFTDKGLLSRSMVLRETVKFLNSKPDYDSEVYTIRVADALIFLQNRLQYVKDRSTIQTISRTITDTWKDVQYQREVLVSLKGLGLDGGFINSLISRSKMTSYMKQASGKRHNSATRYIKMIIRATLPHGVIVLYRRYNKG